MVRVPTYQQVQDRVGKLPDPVEGQNVPTDFFVPGVGLADVDRAVFDLFEKRLRLSVAMSQQTHVVPIVFAGGERFAMVKGDSPPRDRNGMLILPIISITRTGVEQSERGSIVGRGMAQDTGDLVIRKRLSDRDPKIQSLFNRLRLKNQDNVASDENRLSSSAPNGAKPGRVATRRNKNSSFNVVTGELLGDDLRRNIFEIITGPFPHFYVAQYEITFWTQYQQHMNGLVEGYMTSYDAQGNQHKLQTDKGYWFVMYTDDDWQSDDNFKDYSGDERFIRYRFNAKVPAYLWAEQRKGVGVPFRRFLSAPQVSFELLEGPVPARTPSDAPVGTGDQDRFILSDVKELDKRGRPVESTRKSVDKVLDVVHDPFSGRDENRYVRVVDGRGRKGETVLSRRIITKIDDINI